MPKSGSCNFPMSEGDKFGRLTLLAFIRVGKAMHWKCRCECGKTVLRKAPAIWHAVSRSCGCLRSDHCSARAIQRNTRHGMRNTAEYRAWLGMRARCHVKTHKAYASYGGRGIEVCPAWRDDFSAFFASVGPRPTPKHSLDRTDNSRGYEPGNCRWATWTQQALNKRTSLCLTAFDETKPAQEWASDARCRVSYSPLVSRKKDGWPSEQAISLPPDRTGRRRAQEMANA
jgi:hypothetical protein